jgi:hypothetical protein
MDGMLVIFTPVVVNSEVYKCVNVQVREPAPRPKS